jgi:hypothetical protein
MPRGAAIAGRTPLAYPILARLEELGGLDSEWEEPDVHIPAGRPGRR